MLTQLDLDNLQRKIQSGVMPEIYYVASAIETREGTIDESQYKSVCKFTPIKVKVEEISNAYFELLNYKKNADNYTIEEEKEYYDLNTEYIHYYTVRKGKESYDKDLNPRIPSIIYGVRRKYIDKYGDVIEEYNDPSPVIPVYTNVLEYSDLSTGEISTAYNSNKLDWKYLTLDKDAIIDGIPYKYITSNWFIMKINDFPRSEHALVNTSMKSAYFMDLEDAFNFIKECEA